PLPRAIEVRQSDRLVGEFDADNARTLIAMLTDPRDRVPAGPVHARRTPQSIAPIQGLWDPRQLRYRHARPDSVACPQQRTEIYPVLRPQRRNYQVVPAPGQTAPDPAGDH